jgi:hypothetical protein
MTDAFQPAVPQNFAPISASHFAYRDPAQWLPPAAAERLLELRQRVEDRRNLLPDFEQRKSANEEKRAAERRLQELVGHPQEGGHGLGDDHPSVISAKRQLEQVTNAAKRIDDLYETRSRELRAVSAALANVESWRKHGMPAGTMLEQIEVAAPKLNRNESVADAISRHRLRARELKADIARIAASPFPSSHARAKIRQEIEALASQGSPIVSHVIEHNAAIVWPMQRVQWQVIGVEHGALAFGEVPETICLLAWALKDLLLTRLDALVTEEADDPHALSVSDREIRTAEAMSDLLATEIAEAALVRQAQSQNLPCEHRADADPRAILSVQLIALPRPTALPPTSPTMAINYIGPR